MSKLLKWRIYSFFFARASQRVAPITGPCTLQKCHEEIHDLQQCPYVGLDEIMPVGKNRGADLVYHMSLSAY